MKSIDKKMYDYYNVINLQLVIINNFRHYVHNYVLILIDLSQTCPRKILIEHV